MTRIFEKREWGVVIGRNGGFVAKIQPKRKACQTYGRLQIYFGFVVEWRLIFEMMQGRRREGLRVAWEKFPADSETTAAGGV